MPMLQVEQSAILSTFIKLPFVIKIFALSNFKWPFYTGFTVSMTIPDCRLTYGIAKKSHRALTVTWH